jgi:uncharacterized protein YbjT (DUF2867 family)
MILVTGAAWQSGSAIIREFAAQGLAVRALVRNRSKAVGLVRSDLLEVVEGDMSKPETLTAALAGVDQVLLNSSADSRMQETQCTFVDACKSAGVNHIVKFSGGETGFDPSKFRFTEMHERIEDYLEQSGLAWTHLRPSQFMQVYLREARTIIQTGELRLTLGEVQLAPVDVGDIAKIAVALLRGGGHEGRSFPITGPEALNMVEIAERISRTTWRPVRYVAISPEQRRETLLAAGASPYFADALFEQAVERLRNPRAQVHLETHAQFGVKPTSFAEFAERHAAAFAAQVAAV